jgi:hypothetical protein
VSEILLAYQGSLRKLKAIYGSAEDEPAPEALPAFTSDVMRASRRCRVVAA